MTTEGHWPADPAPGVSGAIQAETQDVKQRARVAASQRRRGAGRQARPLLFLPPSVSLLPASVLQDTSLTHRDKLMWLHLRLRLTGPVHEHTLPGLRELSEQTDIGSKDTLARSFAVLRCRRYLSVCATAWHGGGRKVGTAYALHAPRLLVADALFLDPEYPGFVQKLENHASARLRIVAREENLALSAHWPTTPSSGYR
jgi:hypothetical protein